MVQNQTIRQFPFHSFFSPRWFEPNNPYLRLDIIVSLVRNTSLSGCLVLPLCTQYPWHWPPKFKKFSSMHRVIVAPLTSSVYLICGIMKYYAWKIESLCLAKPRYFHEALRIAWVFVPSDGVCIYLMMLESSLWSCAIFQMSSKPSKFAHRRTFEARANESMWQTSIPEGHLLVEV